MSRYKLLCVARVTVAPLRCRRMSREMLSLSLSTERAVRYAGCLDHTCDGGVCGRRLPHYRRRQDTNTARMEASVR